METLDKAILRLEPTIDLLHDCLGFGRFAEVTLTSDGFFPAVPGTISASTIFSEHPQPRHSLEPGRSSRNSQRFTRRNSSERSEAAAYRPKP